MCVQYIHKYISRRLHVCIHNDIHAPIIDKKLYIDIRIFSSINSHLDTTEKKKKRLSRLTVIFHQVAGASSKAPSGDPVPHLGPKADSIGI